MPSEPPDPIPADLILSDDTVPPGAYWSRVIPRWVTVRVTDVDGRGAAALLAYNARQPSERYNAPDTTKVQNMIFLTTGLVLLSDLGRVLFSITADTCGNHETLSGGTGPETVVSRHGREGTYLRLRNERYTNDHDNFVAAVGRHGLDERDLVPNVNLFSRVEVADDGALRWVPGVSAPGAWVDLRAEQDVLAVLSATPHVLDPSPAWRPGALQVTVWRSPPPAADDLCRTRTPEAVRAFDNTDRFHVAGMEGPAGAGRSMSGGAEDEPGLVEHGPGCGSVNPVREEIVGPGEPWSTILPTGARLRITDIEGTQSADTLFYSAADTGERYSSADTIRAQANIFLTTGAVLLSNRGRALLHIVEDTCGRHDTVGGACSAESNICRFGPHTRYMHNCRDNFLVGLARHGLGKRDLVPNINFFMHVPVTAAGRLDIVDGISRAGDYVELVADQDVLVVISNCPQLNNPCNGWNPTPLGLSVWAPPEDRNPS